MVTLQPAGYYTNKLRALLPRDCFRPVPLRLLWLVPYGAVVTGGIAAVALLDLHLLLNLAIALLIGHAFAGLGFLGHEVLHGTVVRSGWLRDLIGALCFLPFNLGPRLWRKWHNVEHHGHTQHEGEDPDAFGTLESYRERALPRRVHQLVPWLRSLFLFVAFAFWFSVHSLLMLRRYYVQFRRRERPVVLAQFVGPALFWVALLAWIGPARFAFAYAMPVLVANFVVMSYIATNHALNPLAPVNDPLATSLTVRVPRLVDILHLNFSHHTEHHLFPGMSPRYAPRVRALCRQLWPERYNEMPHWQALATLWRTPRLYRDDSSLIDPARSLVYGVLGRGLDPNNVRPLTQE